MSSYKKRKRYVHRRHDATSVFAPSAIELTHCSWPPRGQESKGPCGEQRREFGGERVPRSTAKAASVLVLTGASHPSTHASDGPSSGGWSRAAPHPPSTATGDGLQAIQAGIVCRSMSGSHLTYPGLLEPEGRLRLRSCRPTRAIGPHGRQVALSRGVWQRPRAGGRGGDGRAGLALLNRWASCLCVRTSGSAHARVTAGPSGLPATA
eukprot:136987-Prymnesium_polylepis.3